MCNQETHQSLSQPEHFVRHAMNVERARSAVARHDLGRVCMDDVMRDANDALLLADSFTPAESLQMLRFAVEGDLEAAKVR